MSEEERAAEATNKKSDALPSMEVLEKRKLLGEIKELNRPFYQKKEFLIAIVPVVLGIIGMLFSWLTGYFDVKQQKLENTREQIQIQIDKLAQDSTRLYERYESDSLKLIGQYRSSRDSLDGKLEKFRDSIRVVQNKAIDSLNNLRKADEARLNDQISQLDLQNSANKDLITTMAGTINDNRKIIDGLNNQKEDLNNDITSLNNQLAAEKLERQKYKLLSYFKYNRKFEWLGFQQVAEKVGPEFDEPTLSKLIANYEVFFAYNTKRADDPRGIAYNLSAAWSEVTQ